MTQVTSKDVFEGYEFNYRNLFEWDCIVNIRLESNQGVFIRPWVFHSLYDGIVQYYRILPNYKDSNCE